ncbi:ABC transporter permease subunit [Nonomuraea roseoviolacea subsp. roseoviolacea]|uniref:Glycine betaine/proline transport system permease protein n=1 Tax=Nonomuraea roseoviolacea subsp. carminata TaxID=160689 RepID=A0ABT1JZI6_9ACTN|nr:ABC transporter permease subunit [Nonomuraea roseoviolacea]MCP2347160.1 glycine betaine/proline transport system permease protein [Nonomuraea roseoviolacea subsp. carminata]
MTALSATRGVAARLPARRYLIALTLAVWAAGWALLRGHDTFALGGAELTPLHGALNEAMDAVDDSRNTNPLFLYFINYIRLFIDQAVTAVQALISQPALGRPVPVLGWLGVTGLATGVALLYGNRKVALLTAAGFVSFGALGLWQESMDTLALTLTAVVLSLAVGIPLGIWAGLSDRFNRLVTPVLDFMQTMPTFVYLAPLTLFFLIGPASATVATMIYAIPPAIRITAHGIRQVSSDTLEAGTSLGATPAQALRHVRLPMAKQTIIVGVNQTIMAALSMATIAALIDAPGLGQTVLKALQTLDVGTAFNAGVAIVIMAVVLDRVTSAASRRVEVQRRAGRMRTTRGRRLEVAGVLGVAGVLAYLSYTYVWAAEFPIEANAGPYVRRAADAASQWVQDSLVTYTDAFKNLLTNQFLNRLEALLTGTPWWLVTIVAVALALLVGSVRAALVTAAGLLLLVLLGLWQDSMVTLASTIVATVLVMLLGVVAGVWIGRSDRADTVLRPVLDAGQTMPAFVYLVPILGLFGATRFTAIIAAVVFAAPVAIKLVAEGIRGVSPTTVEAATSAGASTWQLISKVQLPMARSAVTLAASQGLIYVLSMVVVGGLVGAGALGYDVVAGFSQHQLRGKGLAAGLAIVVLGIVLDRVMRAATQRADAAAHGGRHQK